MVKDKIPVGFNELKTIYHTADIHIRNVRRHKEYREVFSRLYEEIEKDTDNAVVVVVGDVVHAKLEMSPELIDMTFEFFKTLSSILPTIVVAGNHDTNLANVSRMDALSPIIANIDSDNLFYLKHTGVYDVADTKFVVMSVFQEPTEYPTADAIDGKTKVAIYHGTIHQAISDTGFKLHNERVKTSLFKGYDITLLGDIHRHQILNAKKTVVYPGSLIQQRHGEDINKGILKWDVSSRKWKLISIQNDYSFVTLKVIDGEMPDISGMSSKARLRLKVKDTTTARLTEITAAIRELYPQIEDINDVKIHNIIDGSSEININKINIGNVRDVNFQNELIKSYLDRHHSVNNETLIKIFELNTIHNTQIKPREVSRDIVWRPKLFEFSNLFSYGMNNKINFEELKGIVGLFAPNTTGKSNLVEALSFALFDKSPRTWRAADAMNNKKDFFTARTLLMIGDDEYRVKRDAKRGQLGDVSVKTDFSKKNPDGLRESLNGERRSGTNKVIGSVIGEYEDFSLTALMPQVSNEQKNQNFISMRQGDRKTLLTRFLDLTHFQELYDLASDEMKSVVTKLKEFETREFSKELAHSTIAIKKLTRDYDESLKKKGEYDKLHKQIQGQIKNLSGKLKEIDMSIVDIDKLNQNKKSAETNESEIREEIKKLEHQCKSYKDTQKDIESVSLNIDSDIENRYNKLMELTKLYSSHKHEYDKYQIRVESKKAELGDLGKLEFNPECNNCNDNETFVKSKLKDQKELDIDENIMNEFKEKYEKIQHITQTDYVGVEDEYRRYQDSQDELSDIDKDINECEKEKLIFERGLDTAINNVKVANEKIDLYHKNKQTIESNKEIQEKIDEWENKNIVVEEGIEKITIEMMEIHGKIEVNKQRQKQIEDEIEVLRDLEIKSDAYKYYMESVERDGVPFDLILQTIPLIETEVNNILNQMVDFKILFDVDEQGKDIFPKIVYDEENLWPIELVSGMERFISSVAIRVALIGVSSLPRPNFLIIDEGFGSLDSENANNLYQLFDYLKTQFDFVLIISHLDYVKDMVDQLLEIKKDGDYSKVVV